MRLSLLAFAALLAFTFGTEAKKPPKQPTPPPVVVGEWTKVGTVPGVVSNYTPVVITTTGISVYANTDGNTDGNLYLRTGTWGGVGGAQLVLDVVQPRDTYIRTSAVAASASGVYYAVVYTGDGYPTQGGYSPSFATSSNGVAWTWHGPVGLFGRNQSSAAALVVDEPCLRAWVDIIGLYEMWSCDLGVTWQSNSLNIWPIPNETPQFVTAAKDGQGHIHLMGIHKYGDPYDPAKMRHVVLCHGQYPAKVYAMDAGITDKIVGKGTNLAYDPATNTLHAMTSGTHWQQSAARSYGC